MSKLRILHLEDDASDATFVEKALRRQGIEAEITVTRSAADYQAALEHQPPDLILADSGVPGFSSVEALRINRTRCPEVPFIFVSGAADETEAGSRLKMGAADYVLKDHLWQLPAAIRRACPGQESERQRLQLQNLAMARLVAAVQALALARDLETIMAVTRRAARELTGADGATFILRDGDKCHYADEDAISPLWKGQKFPMSACISGWVMQHREPAVIEDVYADARIPADAYRPTFVKSLVMVPIRTAVPVGAIGNYWAHPHHATPEEVEVLQALANTTSVAMENVRLYAEMDQRVRERTAQLEQANRDLESFSYSVSHDLRAPARIVSGFVGMLAEECHDQLSEQAWDYIARIRTETARMARLIDDLLRLARLLRITPEVTPVSLSQLAGEMAAHYRAAEVGRQVEFVIADGLEVRGDPGLLRVVMENLMSNAWKYTSKTPRARIEFGRGPTVEGFHSLYLRDNGAGFDMKYAERLFAPFQRLHREDEFPGTGVGLATVRRIIERHGGSISAEAEPGQGATFRFTLPERAPQTNG